MKHNKNKECNYLTYKIEIQPTKEVEIMLRKNCEYRHFLYNKCVEVVRDIEKNEDGNLKIDMYGLLAFIRDKYEKYALEDDKPSYLEDYDYYFRGISECVVDDIASTCKRILTNRTKGEKAELRFVKYDPNNLGFRFKNKMHRERKVFQEGRSTQSRLQFTDNPYLIGLKINTIRGKLAIHLREDIRHFNIITNDIKEITIKFHNEKWYLCLIVDCEELFSHIKVFHKRKKVCGIDLGETHPVVLYDGKVVAIPNHLKFPLDKIKKVEIRIKRLQRVLDQKYQKEKDKFHQSNNYYKVLYKFHKAWDHLVNIKKDWHFKLAYWIVTHYKNIVVDEFSSCIRKCVDGYPIEMRKQINSGIQRKSMSIFMERLQHMSLKYGTNYFKALPDTTNTCCKCNHINTYKLLIDATHNERIFTCEECNTTLDRDINASINCYKQYEILKACDAMI